MRLHGDRSPGHHVSRPRAIAAVLLVAVTTGCIKRATIEFVNGTLGAASIITPDNQACTAAAGGRCRIWFHPHLVVVTGDVSRAYDLPPIAGDLDERAKWEVSEGFMDRILRLRLGADLRLSLIPAPSSIATGVHQPPGYPVMATMATSEPGQ